MIVDIVSSADPDLPAALVGEVVERVAAAPVSLARLVDYLTEHPEALTAGHSCPPKVVGALIAALVAAGSVALVVPRALAATDRLSCSTPADRTNGSARRAGDATTPPPASSAVGSGPSPTGRRLAKPDARCAATVPTSRNAAPVAGSSRSRAATPTAQLGVRPVYAATPAPGPNASDAAPAAAGQRTHRGRPCLLPELLHAAVGHLRWLRWAPS